jgi:hypothetical protein
MKPYTEAIYRDPFVIGAPTTAKLSPGLNVAEMVSLFPLSRSIETLKT